VLPSVVDEPLTAGLSPKQTVELLRGAVAKNQAELCTMTEDFGVLSLQGCNVEFKDLGFAMPTIEALSGKTLMHGTPEQLAEPQETDTQALAQVSDIIIIFGSVAAAVVLFSAVLTLCTRASATKSKSMVQTVEVSPTYETKVAAMEEGKSVVDEKPMQDDDNNSTLCPSDNRSEPSLCDDADIQSQPSICSASAIRQGRESESSPAAARA